MFFDVVGEVLAGSNGQVGASDHCPGNSTSKAFSPSGRRLEEKSGQSGGGDGVDGVVFGISALGNDDTEDGIHERHDAEHLSRGGRSLGDMVEDLRSP